MQICKGGGRGMTKEIREYAKSRIEYLLKVSRLDERDKEALEAAIKALSQEPCIYDLKNRYCPRLNEHGMLKYPLQEPTDKPMCDRNICVSNEYNGIGCDECVVNKPQEPCDDAISRDFQIGDEVRIIGSDPIYDDCDVGWVIRNASEKVKTMYVMRNDGSADEEAKAEWYKTGRHNAMLAEVIKALPSVTQKSGKWMLNKENEDADSD